MGERKLCIACGRDIEGRPIELRPRDPKYALCRSCNGAPSEAVVTDANAASASCPYGASDSASRVQNTRTETPYEGERS